MNGKEDQVLEPTENKKPRLETSYRDTNLSKKREDYLEWPEYFMAIAFLSAQRSKDPGRNFLHDTGRKTWSLVCLQFLRWTKCERAIFFFTTVFLGEKKKNT